MVQDLQVRTEVQEPNFLTTNSSNNVPMQLERLRSGCGIRVDGKCAKRHSYTPYLAKVMQGVGDTWMVCTVTAAQEVSLIWLPPPHAGPVCT